MTALVKIVEDVPVVSTLDMWQGLGVDHNALIQAVRKHESLFQEIRNFGFLKSKNTGRGRPITFCYLNEEQTTFLITLMRNSEQVVAFKHRLTREFYRMRNVLSKLSSQRQNAEWLEARNSGKLARKVETDALKRFVDYATAQGSTHAKEYYRSVSKMQNKALFFVEQKFKNLRDILNLNQLAIVVNADDIVTKALEDGMDRELHYKEIYKLAKTRIESFAELRGKTFIPSFPEQRQIPTTRPLLQA